MSRRTAVILLIIGLLIITEIDAGRKRKNREITAPPTAPPSAPPTTMGAYLLTEPKDAPLAPATAPKVPDCVSGGSVAILVSNMAVSSFMVYIAAVLLLLGVFQILLGLFVFLAEALDIYMLLINYCIATIFCITTIMLTGSGVFEASQKMCMYASPLSAIAISVPMFTLFLLSYSRFYAITYPFYYVDRFTVLSQAIVCALSWLIPVAVVGLGSSFLCQSESSHVGAKMHGSCLIASQNTPLHAYSIPLVNMSTPEILSLEDKIANLTTDLEAKMASNSTDTSDIKTAFEELKSAMEDYVVNMDPKYKSTKWALKLQIDDRLLYVDNTKSDQTNEIEVSMETFKKMKDKYQEGNGDYRNIGGSYPARVECQIYMMLYSMVCLIFPLLGCIVCYGSIVYQLTIIKKNREKMTNTSSVAADADKLVTVNAEDSEASKPLPSLKSSLSMKSLKHHLKRQTSIIQQKAKDKIPVSVILILTLYIFVAVPLTVVEIFNTVLSGESGDSSYINLALKEVIKLRDAKAAETKFCDNDNTMDISAIPLMTWVVDICYSLGMLSLGLSPWAYIKFTKSFEENLWKKPFSKFSESLGLEIQKSVRKKHTSERNAARKGGYSAPSVTTSGYATGATAQRPSNSNPAARHNPAARTAAAGPGRAAAGPGRAAAGPGRTSAGGTGRPTGATARPAPR